MRIKRRSLSLCFQVFVATALVACAHADEPAVSLLGPDSLAGWDYGETSGWWCPGKIDAWKVQDGELVKAGGGGNYLRTEKLYGDFTLSLDADGRPVAGWEAAKLTTLLGGPGNGEFRSCLAGVRNGLAWRYLMLAPVEFDKSLKLTIDKRAESGRLVLYYQDTLVSRRGE
jgi:hypothetical protein